MVGQYYTSSSNYHHDQKEVVFISTPAMGMLPPTIEFARHLVLRGGGGITATVLLIPVPHWPAIHSYTQSLLSNSSPTLRFHLLPTMVPPPPDRSHNYVAHVSSLVDSHMPHVKTAVSELLKRRRVVGMFYDMFCSSMADVADELGLCSYLFFASPAGFLSFILDMPALDLLLADESVAELTIRGFANPVPKTVLATSVLKREDGYFRYLEHAKRYVDTKGIVVNTVRVLEPFVLDSLSVTGLPKIYPVGPILTLESPVTSQAQKDTIMTWLDGQPESSVVFLCFGSLGSFSGPQVREIALGLKRAGFRFLWSCRDQPKSEMGLPAEYASFGEVLPDGFLEESRGVGLVCGWVPQVGVLAHPAVGGFVSHCGWNSILESLWHGVPIATWPIYAEQQMNAFEMVEELGLAVEIRMDYREGSDLVLAEEVERGIKRLMVGDEEARAKVRDMRSKIRMALMENGSSSESLGALVDQLVAN